MAETHADQLSRALPEGWVGFCVLWSHYASRAPPLLMPLLCTLTTRRKFLEEERLL